MIEIWYLKEDYVSIRKKGASLVAYSWLLCKRHWKWQVDVWRQATHCNEDHADAAIYELYVKYNIKMNNNGGSSLFI